MKGNQHTHTHTHTHTENDNNDNNDCMIFNDPFPLFTVRVPAARSTVHTTA